jgi:folate-dependent phosphoribosylglycinamide formyltransferase PurN
MNVVVVTTEGLVQRHFAARLSRQCHVLEVVHPARVSAWRKAAQASLHPGSALARLAPLCGWNKARELRNAAERLLPRVGGPHGAHSGLRVTHVEDINHQRAIDSIRALNPEAIICLGGPIYADSFIRMGPPILNVHTGISPLYNGASSLFFAFADGNVHLCGATLMHLSKRIDGGDVIAHYFPSVELTDDPATLFIKSIHGSVDICAQFVSALRSGSWRTHGVPQGKVIRYTRSRDWTLATGRAISRHLRSGVTTGFISTERSYCYWRLPPLEARAKFEENILTWSRSYAAPSD